MLLNYEADKMRELLKSFYMLTRIRIVVFNDEFDKIAEVPEGDCAFCEIIRTDPIAKARCSMSDKRACRTCKEQNTFYSYTCHAGLTETVAPIFHGTVVIGYLMFGQVLTHAGHGAYWPEIERLCAEYNIDRFKLKQAYARLEPMEMEKVYAAARLLEACAGYLWLQKYVTLMEDNLLNRFDDYITNNLQADLSVTALCRHFNIGRSKLYKTVSGYYGCGIEQLTRMLRIKKAKELLEGTLEPVSEVSHRVGYSDYNYFIKIFKAETGKTPHKYRKDYKQASQA